MNKHIDLIQAIDNAKQILTEKADVVLQKSCKTETIQQNNISIKNHSNYKKALNIHIIFTKINILKEMDALRDSRKS